MKQTKDVYSIVTEKILNMLKQNENPWIKPWVTRNLDRQRNLVSNRPYTGLNALLLALENKPTDFWLTFNQAKAAGYSVRKGEKSTLVVGWFKSTKTVETENDDDTTDIETRGAGLRCRYFRVFNVSQLENVPQDVLDKVKRPEIETFGTSLNQDAENLIAKTKANIVFGVEQACYRPSTDEVSMPDRNRFPHEAEFYSTMFHELGHWTGHKSRLDRLEVGRVNLFNNSARSQEELCAEMCSVYVCSSIGVSSETTTRNSVAYLQSWLRFLKENPKAFVIACQQGQKAADFLVVPRE